jgi:hypothetical protein
MKSTPESTPKPTPKPTLQLILAATVLSLLACATPSNDAPVRFTMSASSTSSNPAAPVLASGSNAHFTRTVTVRAPAARIWSIWMDVPNWPTWDTELKSANAKGPLALGVEGALLPLSGRASTFKVVAFEEGRMYAFETALPLGRLTIRRELVQAEGSTTFTHDVRFSGLSGPVFASLFGPGFRVALPAVMDRIAVQAVR